MSHARKYDKTIKVQVQFYMSFWQCLKIRLSGLKPQIDLKLRHERKRLLDAHKRRKKNTK